MIAANELRIGNWVKDSLGYLVIGVNAKVEFASAYEPIPITHEILEKCGFEKYTENTGAPINEDIDYYSNQIDVFFDVHGCLILKDYHYNINRPKYLHQLQNLYFALTGEELNYQP